MLWILFGLTAFLTLVWAFEMRDRRKSNRDKQIQG